MARQRIRWQNVAPGGDPTIGSTSASNRTYPFCAGVGKASVHVVGGAGFTGTPRIYGSDDHNPEGAAADPWNGEWEDLSSKLDTPMVAPAGGVFKYLIGLAGLPFEHFYFDLAYSAGAGSTVRATFAKNDAA